MVSVLRLWRCTGGGKEGFFCYVPRHSSFSKSDHIPHSTNALCGKFSISNDLEHPALPIRSEINGVFSELLCILFPATT